MTKILNGIRIIDFTQGHLGSYGTMLLSDFGAEVIKIEDPKTGGDVMRTLFPKNEKGSAYHAYMNRGKKSVCIDRTSKLGQNLIMELIKTADIVCDSFPAGELERFHLGYDDAYKINPGIIYATHTAFGKTGPLKYTAGSNLTAEAICGLMDVTGHEGSPPTTHGSRMANQFGSVFFATAIVAGLIARDKTGEGQQIDVASADCMFTALEDILIDELFTGRIYQREGNKSRAIAPYDTFKVKDGYVSTAVSTNTQWEKFCRAMDMQELLRDTRFESNESRGENYMSVLQNIIADRLGDMTREEIEERLRPLNIPSGPVLKVSEAFESEQLNSRNMVIEIEDKTIGRIRMPGIPIKMYDNEEARIESAPLLGEDTRALLSDIHCSEEEIDYFIKKGIIICEGGITA